MMNDERNSGEYSLFIERVSAIILDEVIKDSESLNWKNVKKGLGER